MATTGTAGPAGPAPWPRDTEVGRARRSWSASYKLGMLAQIDAAERGEVGKICGWEGLYSSLISECRKQRDRGARKGCATASRARPAPTRFAPSSLGCVTTTPEFRSP
jgi:hypothetical protein